MGNCIYCKNIIEEHKLKKCNSNIQVFSYNGLYKNCKIVDVYDGDTFKACFYYNGELIKYTFRTLGYDSPEMKPKLNKKNRNIEKKKAIEARDYFIKLTNDKNGIVKIKFGKFDKYGRILATVYNKNNKNVNNLMIESGHGIPYDGGKKKEFKY